ncbi:MAG: hypothetical protein WKF84_10060 [Pyrinomonadaceae bacterium]
MLGSLKQHPDSPAYLKGVSQLLLQENPLDTPSEAFIKHVVQILPIDAEAQYLYGQWAYLNKKYELSIETLTKALSLSQVDDQKRLQIYALMGLAEDARDNAANAEAAFTKSLEFNRKLGFPSPFAVLRHIEFLNKRARDKEAQSLIDELLQQAPSFGLAHFERAKYLVKQNRIDEAITAGKQALQYSAGSKPQLLAVHAFLAKTLHAAGRTNEAQAHQSWIERAAATIDLLPK